MNIRRWLHRRGRLIAATLAMTAALAISPVPASAASVAPASASVSSVFCNLTVNYPQQTASGALVSADAWVMCFGGAASAINLSLFLTRDGVIVDSVLVGGTAGASALTIAACVPGWYQANGSATIWYPAGNIPPTDSFQWTSISVYISCAPVPQPFTVVNPGLQWTYLYTYDTLQMTATGGTAPYIWSASGLPTNMSINPSTGLISGLANRLANYTVTIAATDATGHTASTQFTWSVKRNPCQFC